jgi:hypothetical protein
MVFVYLVCTFLLGGSIGLLCGCVLSGSRIGKMAAREALLIKRLQRLEREPSR